MKKTLFLGLLSLTLSLGAADSKDGWITLFDGKSLDGWKFNEKPGTFVLEDGKLVVNGPRSHLFYNGPVQNHDFKNFELKLEIMTFPGSNSGVYFHTQYEDEGWPTKGYEIQVNNSHTDPKRTAGVYGIQDNMEAPAKDNEWFTMTIIVQGKRIITKVNDKTISDYTEPDDVKRTKQFANRLVSHGTIAIQGHDPKSKVMYKRIAIKPLP